MEWREEFRRQKEINDREWEVRLENQKRSDEQWDRRIKEQHESTMKTVQDLVENFTVIMEKKINNDKIFRTKRKMDKSIEEDEELDEQEQRKGDINFDEERMRLRRRVSTTQEALNELNSIEAKAHVNIRVTRGRKTQ